MVPAPNFPFIGTTTADRFMNASLGEFSIQEKVISQIEMTLWKASIMYKSLLKYGKTSRDEVIENLRTYNFSFSVANAPYLGITDKNFKKQMDQVIDHYSEGGFKVEVIYSKAKDHMEYVGMDNIPPETMIAEVRVMIKREVFERYFKDAKEAETNQ